MEFKTTAAEIIKKTTLQKVESGFNEQTKQTNTFIFPLTLTLTMIFQKKLFRCGGNLQKLEKLLPLPMATIGFQLNY